MYWSAPYLSFRSEALYCPAIVHNTFVVNSQLTFHSQLWISVKTASNFVHYLSNRPLESGVYLFATQKPGLRMLGRVLKHFP